MQEVGANLTLIYRINGKGEIHTAYHFLPDGSIQKQDMPEIPRVGMFFRIPSLFSRVSWYGRGPHENYVDRKTSAFMGIHHSTTADLYVPYIRPQENGYRTDTRWMALYSEEGHGLMVSGHPRFCFSSLPYSTESLDYTQSQHRHTTDIHPSGFTELYIDYGQTGVGGDDSWGARPYPQYTLHYGEYYYEFTLKPFSALKEAGL